MFGRLDVSGGFVFGGLDGSGDSDDPGSWAWRDLLSVRRREKRVVTGGTRILATAVAVAASAKRPSNLRASTTKSPLSPWSSITMCTCDDTRTHTSYNVCHIMCVCTCNDARKHTSSLSPFLSLSRSPSLSCSFSPYLSHTHIHTRTHTHIQTHTHTLFLLHYQIPVVAGLWFRVREAP